MQAFQMLCCTLLRQGAHIRDVHLMKSACPQFHSNSQEQKMFCHDKKLAQPLKEKQYFVIRA